MESLSQQMVDPELLSGFGFFKKQDIETLWQIQSGRCYFCGTALGQYGEKKAFDIDHLDPICKGGGEWPDNLALTCSPCNAKKHFRSERQYWNLLKKKRGSKWVAEQRKRVTKIRPKRAKLADARFDERYEALVEFHHEMTSDLCSRLGIDTDSDAVPKIKFKDVSDVARVGFDSYRIVWNVRMRVGRRYRDISLAYGSKLSLRIWYKKYGAKLMTQLASLIK